MPSRSGDRNDQPAVTHVRQDGVRPPESSGHDSAMVHAIARAEWSVSVPRELPGEGGNDA